MIPSTVFGLISLAVFSSVSKAQQPLGTPAGALGAAPGATAPRANPNSACKLGQPAANPSSLVDLTLYSNEPAATGTAIDHYLTTIAANDPSLQGYNKQQVLGKVMVDAAACDCPVRLVQFVDNSPSPFGAHIDHKLARDGDEPNRLGENYTETDEAVYCVQRKGGCGASIPLYKDFNAINYDSMYSTNETATPWTERYPARPLCYIWSAAMVQPGAAGAAGQLAIPGQASQGGAPAGGQTPGAAGQITQPGQSPPAGQFAQGHQ